MAEPHVLTSLRKKRADIEDLIATLDKRLALARRDLAHVSATIKLFEAPAAPGDVRSYTDLHRLFRRGEIVTLCKAALAAEGPLDTRELSRRVVAAKGFNEADNELRKAIAFRIVQALTMQAKRGLLASEKRGGLRVWRIS
ncbi:MAG TPA: hypothetical protein VHD15_13790 [Hyphomicrobiales bacterium]|nr:hypothetical protein [Hyphomicrobiales bacterium]